jgi:hypothetical protein
MRRPGFEPGFWAWKAQVIATRPSTQTATHLEVFVKYNVFARHSLFFHMFLRYCGISFLFLTLIFSIFMKSSTFSWQVDIRSWNVS